MGVLLNEPYCLGSISGPLMFGNSHTEPYVNRTIQNMALLLPMLMTAPGTEDYLKKLWGAPFHIGLSKNLPTSSTPQLPFKIPHIATNRDHKALNKGTLGGLGYCGAILDFCDTVDCSCWSSVSPRVFKEEAKAKVTKGFCNS